MSSPPDLATERRAFNRNARMARFCPCCLSEGHSRSPAVLMPFVAHRALGWQPVEIDDSWNLRTIKNGHAYSICNSVECATCGLVFLDIRFSDDELSRLYHDYRGEDYTRLREGYEPGYSVHNDELKAGIPYLAAVEDFLRPHVTLPLSLLDWGGDTGRNSPFKAQAKPFHIYDISHAPPVAGAAFVALGDIGKEDYDLIVCSNVLEHIPHPIDLLEEIARYMTDKTVLYLEAPFETFMYRNRENPDVLKGKKHWHEHVNFFTLKSLEYLCRNAGLDIVQSKLLALPELAEEANAFQLACRRRN
jgi:hypothetical protein